MSYAKVKEGSAARRMNKWLPYLLVLAAMPRSAAMQAATQAERPPQRRAARAAPPPRAATTARPVQPLLGEGQSALLRHRRRPAPKLWLPRSDLLAPRGLEPWLLLPRVLAACTSFILYL